MSTVYYDYTVKEKGHPDMHFLIKAEEGVIADVIVPFKTVNCPSLVITAFMLLLLIV